MTFEDLNLSAPLLRAVKEEGYSEPSPIQAKAIPPVLSGRDLLGCAQTGTGKTAAFALPMLQNLTNTKPKKQGAIRALILTPTRELALQIGQSFTDYGKYLHIRHTVIFGGVGQQPQVDALKRGVDVLVACPGRLNDLIGQGYIHLENVEYFVLDEADRMLDMGFIHDVKKVIAKLPPKTARQTLLFSATMPKEIEQLADGLLNHPDTVKVDPVSSTVDRIAQSLYFVEKGNKKLLLTYLIRHLNPPVTNALVFSRTKHGADKIVKDLEKDGITAAAIHGNKGQNARVAALEGFKAGKTQVLVATDIAARGIDINELAYVFNYDLPEVPETYVHRIGRTARAGADGCAVSFCAPEEREYLAGIEKLNRNHIPVVSGHPYDGVPAPKKEIVPLRGRRPAAPAPLKPNRKEEPPMEDQEKKPLPQAGENAEGGAKHRRRRRGRGHGGQNPAAAQPMNAQSPAEGQTHSESREANAGHAPHSGRDFNQRGRDNRPGQPARGSNAQPKFDPHFLTPQAASQVQRAQPGRPEMREDRPARDARSGQPRHDFNGGNNGPRGGHEANVGQHGRDSRPAPRTAPQPAKEEDPGLLLISRRAPQQKFTSFDDYMTAHGGATAPIEETPDYDK